MFEGDLATLTTADLLASAADHDAEARRVDARRLEHAQVYADRFHPDARPVRPGRRSWEGRERAVVLGGDGCPEILEFAIAEFAVILGISPRVAANYIGQALALRHRFPFTWARVQAGDATPWKACRIVADCAKLSADAAAYVDQRIARLIDSITPYRLNKIVKAAKMHADADLARAEAAEKARERGVFVGRADEHGTKTMYIKAAAGAVIRTKATLDAIAEALKTFGDTRPVQHRRADAVGILADPRYTQELLTRARHHHLTTPAQDTAGSDTTARETAARETAGPDAAGPVSTSRPGASHRGAGCSEAGDDDRPHATIDDLARARVDHQVDSGDGVAVAGASGMPGAGSASRWGGEDRTGIRGEPGLDDEADRDAPHPSGSDLRDPLDTPDTVPTESGLDDEADRDAPHPSGSDLPDPLDTPDTVPIEPGLDDEADRDAPHPSSSDLPDPLDTPDTVPIEPFDPAAYTSTPTTAGPWMRPPAEPCTPAWHRSNTTPTPTPPADESVRARPRSMSTSPTTPSPPAPAYSAPNHRPAARRPVGRPHRLRPVHRQAGHRPQRRGQRRRLRDPRPDPRTHQTHPPRRVVPVRHPRNPPRHGPGPPPALRPPRPTRPNQHH